MSTAKAIYSVHIATQAIYKLTSTETGLDRKPSEHLCCAQGLLTILYQEWFGVCIKSTTHHEFFETLYQTLGLLSNPHTNSLKIKSSKTESTESI